MPEDDPLTAQIIGCAITIHRTLGPGLLEAAYEKFLCRELEKAGLKVLSQPAMPVTYDGYRVDLAYRPDLIVNNQVIVEVKGVQQLAPNHTSQLVTYLTFAEMELGLLINFHSMPLYKGIKRVSVNKKNP